MRYFLAVVTIVFSTNAFSEQFIRGIIGDQFVSGVATVGAEYNRWNPLRLKVLDVKTQGYQVGYAEVALKFKNFSIPKIRYETNFGGSKQDEVIDVQKNEGDHAKYENLIGVLKFRKYTFKYNKETYISDVSAIDNFIYISREGAGEQVFAGLSASFATQFESYSIGREIYSYNLGIFYSTYKKPYFLTLDTEQLTDYLWNAEFQSLGLEISKTWPRTTWGMPITTAFNFRAGQGSIDFGVFSLADVLPPETEVLFWELNISPQWSKIVNKKTTYNLALETSYKKFFYSTDNVENQDKDGLDLNSDVTLKFLASVSYKF